MIESETERKRQYDCLNLTKNKKREKDRMKEREGELEIHNVTCMEWIGSQRD